jgi:hypothetical protein
MHHDAAAGIQAMTRRFRYRTTVLVGSWRPSFEQAIEDAINAKQAARENSGPNGIKWIVPGQIEEAEAREPLAGRN